MTRAERHAHWQTIIDTQVTSGMCIAAYCRTVHIKPSNFYTWRRRIRDQQPSARGFLELIPGRLTEATSGVSVHLGGRLSIEVTRGFDPFTLRAVVETLNEYSRCSA
ncbi:MAG: hypothetical protein M0Z71_03925 [Nitrospiraceae bacterium]|nr:hypothetical protein [Nitrospiraceae bacterium]